MQLRIPTRAHLVTLSNSIGTAAVTLLSDRELEYRLVVCNDTRKKV